MDCLHNYHRAHFSATWNIVARVPASTTGLLLADLSHRAAYLAKKSPFARLGPTWACNPAIAPPPVRDHSPTHTEIGQMV
jgi:hypothetical protein